MKVMNQLEMHLYGAYPPDTPSLDSYWESIYHADDDVTKPSSAHFTAFASFLRTSLRWLLLRARGEPEGGTREENEACGVPGQAVVREVSVLRISEQFKGVVVSIRDALAAASDSPRDAPEFEIFFSPVSHLARGNSTSSLARRVSSLEVGSNWDGKESIFRNYPGVLGAWDEPVAAVRIFAGQQEHVSLTWTDPVGVKLTPNAIKLEAGWFVSYQKPKLELPIRPGVWSVELKALDATVIMERKFLVVPLAYDKKEPLEVPPQTNARRADVLRPGVDAKKFMMWKAKVLSKGSALEAWVDELVGEFWKVEGACRTVAVGDECSSWLPACASTPWSTHYPDPKSDVGVVRSDSAVR